MATEIIIPKLGLTMEEALLTTWSVDEGQKVAAQAVIAIIETDKITYEIEAPADGWLHRLAKEGTKVPVSQVIGYLAEDEAELALLQKQGAPAGAEPLAVTGDKKAAKPVAAVAEPRSDDWVVATPLARRMAREHNLDLTAIKGTGAAGRVVEADILKALESPPQAQAAPARAADAPSSEAEPLLTTVREIPIQGIRKAIFNNMHKSLNTQAQLTLQAEASARGMMEIRNLFNQVRSPNGARISFNAILVKAAALALRRHPIVNSSVDGEVIKIWKQIHVGLAIDLGSGLIVPKIRLADTKSIAEISTEIEEMVDRAKNKTLGPDDLSAGTFTITNLGAWGVEYFTPIVNFPESAILGVGRIAEKPCVVNGQVVIESRLALSLSFDHRIVDGAPAADFFKTLREMIEEPRLMI